MNTITLGHPVWAVGQDRRPKLFSIVTTRRTHCHTMITVWNGSLYSVYLFYAYYEPVRTLSTRIMHFTMSLITALPMERFWKRIESKHGVLGMFRVLEEF